MKSKIIFCRLLIVTLQFPICICFADWPKEIIVANVGNRLRKTVSSAVLNDAEADLKEASIIPQNLTIKHYMDFGCDDLSSLSAVAKLNDKYHPDVFLGPECSTGMPAGALLTSFYNIATVGYVSILSDLNNKTKYRTLSRVGFNMGPMGKAVKTLMIMNNWTRVAIVRSARVECTTALSGIYNELSPDTRFKITGEFYADTQSEMIKALNQVKLVARIIILCFDYIPSSSLDFLIQANSFGMVNSEYVYIVPCFSLKAVVSWKPWDNMNNNETDKKLLAKTAFSSAIVIQTVGEELSILNEYKSYIEAVFRSKKQPVLTSEEAYTVGRLHDAMYLYGMALNITIQSEGDYHNGSQIFEATKLINFEGASGKIVMDSNAERIPEFIVYSKSIDNEFTPTHNFTVSFLDRENYTYAVKTLRNPYWNTVNNEIPRDVPICGFAGELCKMSSSNTVAMTIGLAAGFAVIFITAYILYRKRKNEQELIRMSWKINLKELQVIQPSKGRGMQSMSSMITSGNGSDKTSLPSIGQTDGSQGSYKGEIVTIHRYKKLTMVYLNRAQLLNLKTLRDINHENLNRFIGANLYDDSDVIILWKYCSKGNLAEIVYNDDIQLDMMFKTSMIKDIISGLEFLHKSSLGCHGNLNCNTCLVDSRWIVKLSDFGLITFVNGLKEKKSILINEMDERYSDFAHLAPEVVKYGIEHADKKCADIFSLAIVFYQILFRQDPFADQINCERDDHGTFYSPKFPENCSDVDPKLLMLMQKSWSEYPTERPTIVEIKNGLSGFTKKFGKNLVDHIMSMLEKYANNLEKIVDERTQQVVEERRRADQLLYQLLPRTIADALKKGDSILPEFYDSVTVYFSDIVQFTNLSARSTPLQVVTMLNTLYSEFDALMSNFDVYKVETIGDAYMVVSGLPMRNGNKHITEIADMALAVMKYMSSYRVPHFPELALHLRIGIHSGPAAAGVVGLKMPHFCLFGDTVNVASRMESSGEADKIQISETSHDLLKVYGNHKVILRGLTQIKGKGLCNTYWLEEKTEINT